MKKSILLFTSILTLHGMFTRLLAQETVIQYLSGADKDHPVSWEFNCTKGKNSGSWTNIPVPSLWEQQGFGTNGHDNSSEKGQYRIAFPSDKDWQNKRAFIVFDGVMTDAVVRLNGKLVGEHQGSFTQFSFEVTSLLRYSDPNLLEVTVTKASANASIDRVEKGGDLPASGGIYRPVYIKVVPEVYVERVAIDAKADGNLSMQVVSRNTKAGQTIDVQIADLQGKDMGVAFQANAAENTDLKKQFTVFKTWNPELPNMYQAVVSIKEGSTVLHTYRQRFGFRTVENKSDGLYLNGTKVVFKGLNRRFSDAGLVPSTEATIADINLMKDMNMNAIRISNYPADPRFLDMCDSLGLLVINELTSPSQPGYDAETNKRLIKDIVARDVNHPAVVMWANDIDKDDKEFAAADIQSRFVIHPSQGDAKKTADFSSLANSILYGTEAYVPTEFSKNLYNGGRAAGLEDFWADMSKSSKFSGTFLWSFRDELGDDPSAPPADPKQLRGYNFNTIREVWSPVVFDVAGNSFTGNFNVENRYLFTNLNKCRFDWKLVLYPKATEKRTAYTVVGEGTAVAPFIGPGEKGSLKITLPSDYNRADALLMVVVDGRGKEIYSQTWAIRSPADVMKTYPEVASISTIMETVDTNFHSIVCDGINYIFDKHTGNIAKVYVGKRDLPFFGPFLAGTEQNMAEFKHTEKDRVHVVEVTYKGDNALSVKWTFRTGDLPKMEYSYAIKAPVDYTGITFRYPEEKVIGMKWMGRGPWQVWKNRTKGLPIGVWEKSNRVSSSGEMPKNAEFKGWHSDIYWIQFQTNMGNFTIYNEQPNIYLQLFSPMRQSPNLANEFSNPPFPENGNISFMHGISSIGTKFQPEGKQSKSLKNASDQLTGTLWFDFRW